MPLALLKYHHLDTFLTSRLTRNSFDKIKSMRTFLSMFREKEFWSGALQIALGLYLGFVSLLAAFYLFSWAFEAVTR